MRTLYSLVFLALLPFVILRLFLKGRHLKGYRERILERFGIYSAPLRRGPKIWIHAVSVGECEAAFPLIRRLARSHPDLGIVMTCTTATGSSRIKAVLGKQVDHVYLPYDVPLFVNRFLDYVEPTLGVIMETEIWPNLFVLAGKRDIPLVIANGRLSDKSVKGYTRLTRLIHPALSAIRLVAAQSQSDADRYVELGMNPDSVQNMGNIKFDIAWETVQRNDSDALKARLFQRRPVLVAGSTHPGEEEMVLDAYGLIKKSFRDLTLVLVPRHPERGAECLALCTSRGFVSHLLSERESFNESDEILVIDRVGELRRYYGASEVAYIGGSLVPHGGQNPLEPLVAGIPVIFGPYMMNFREIRDLVLKSDAGFQVDSPETLAEQVQCLLQDSHRRRAMGERGEKMIITNQGALERLTSALEPWLASSQHIHP